MAPRPNSAGLRRAHEEARRRRTRPPSCSATPSRWPNVLSQAQGRCRSCPSTSGPSTPPATARALKTFQKQRAGRLRRPVHPDEVHAQAGRAVQEEPRLLRPGSRTPTASGLQVLPDHRRRGDRAQERPGWTGWRCPSRRPPSPRSRPPHFLVRSSPGVAFLTGCARACWSPGSLHDPRRG